MVAHISQLNDFDKPIPSLHSIYFANFTCPSVYLSTCLPVHLPTSHEISVTASPSLCELFFIVWGILNLSPNDETMMKQKKI